VNERQQILPLLRSHLRHSQQPEITGHCDAGTLAAFAECTLDRTERDRVADHLSQCQNCRDTLALAAEAAPSSPTEMQFHVKGIYAIAALASLCIAAVIFQHAKTLPAAPQQQQQPVASNNPPPVLSFNGPPAFSPRLTGAQVIEPILTVPTPLWRINSSRSPATLEISYTSGRTWAPIRTPDFQPKSVAAEGANVWVADAKGTVLESTDLGLHWRRLPHTVQHRLSAR